MSKITDVPQTVSTAGHSLNYATWPANTAIRLANVPWNNDYKDVVRFNSANDFAAYVTSNAGPVINVSRASYAKFGEPINIPVTFNVAQRYNYVLVENYPNPSGDDFYHYPYFITGVEYVNPGTTRIYVQLDVWQMFGRLVKFGRGYVERGHVGIANTKSQLNNGRDYLTIPEGLDVGGEYMVRDIFETTLTQPDNDYNCSVIVVSSVSFRDSGGDVSNPVLVSADGQDAINGIPSGADVYFFETPRQFKSFLFQHREKPWVTQGIMAAYMIPPMKFSDVVGTRFESESGVSATYEGKEITSYPKSRDVELVQQWRQYLIQTLPARYSVLRKFLTYPYTFLELTMHNGMPLVIKPESLSNDSTLKVELLSQVTPPNPRVMVVPKTYNDDTNSEFSTARGEWLDFATGITNMPQIPIVNNGYMNYMATNNRQIEFQHQSADWSQNRVMASANTSYEQATGQIGTNTDINAQTMGANTASMGLANETAGYNALASGVGGVISAAGRGNVGGALGSIVSAGAGYAIQTNQNTQQTGITNRLAQGRVGSTNAQAGLVRDTNLDFASYAAKGDYSNAIAGINARVQDAKMIQPTISGQSGGEGFNFSVMGGYKIFTKIKQIDNNVMTMIGEFWLRYGYSVNRFHRLTQLNVMSKFTYWKVKELYLTSSYCPETYRQTIRGIFEKGVTVWENPDDIANLDIADNASRTGITL